MRDKAQAVLAFDPDNSDAREYQAAAERALGATPIDSSSKRKREFMVHVLTYAVTMFGVFALFHYFLGLHFITLIVGVAWGLGVGFHGVSLLVPPKRRT